MTDSGFSIPVDVIQKAEQVKTQQKDFALFSLGTASVRHLRSFPETEEEKKAFDADSNREAQWQHRVYPAFFQALTEQKEPCWCVVDVRGILQDGRKCSKVVVVAWCPDKACVKS